MDLSWILKYQEQQKQFKSNRKPESTNQLYKQKKQLYTEKIGNQSTIHYKTILKNDPKWCPTATWLQRSLRPTFHFSPGDVLEAARHVDGFRAAAGQGNPQALCHGGFFVAVDSAELVDR